MSKRYNTPHRDRIIKTRVTEEEHADFMERLTAYGMSQSEFIRQAITGATVKPIIIVSPVNDELLASIGRLTGEYGKIGGNLNQIARYPSKQFLCLGARGSLNRKFASVATLAVLAIVSLSVPK